MIYRYMESAVRGLIAVAVILVTWLLTSGSYDIAEQWQAVFLMVIGYYFKERPQSDRFASEVFRDRYALRAVDVELGAQFLIAFVLLLATIWLFAAPHNQEFLTNIAGAWVGGVTLAIAFYFKDVTDQATTPLHSFFRSVLAVSVVIGTIVIFFARTQRLPVPSGTQKVDPLPLQWVALAFVVIAFYFKERGQIGAPPTAADQHPLVA